MRHGHAAACRCILSLHQVGCGVCGEAARGTIDVSIGSSNIRPPPFESQVPSEARPRTMLSSPRTKASLNLWLSSDVTGTHTRGSVEVYVTDHLQSRAAFFATSERDPWCQSQFPRAALSRPILERSCPDDTEPEPPDLAPDSQVHSVPIFST